MTQGRLNHVSVLARDLDTSIRFYEDVFGLEHVPSPNYQTPVEWLRSGDLQLHLFERDVQAPRYHHFAIHVEEFEAVYQEVKERGIITDIADDQPEDRVYVMPNDELQMYVTDPAGNVVEVNHHDVTRIDDSIVTDLFHRKDENPDIDAGDAARARLLFDGFLDADRTE
jgi:lactoylglutathione lyase